MYRNTVFDDYVNFEETVSKGLSAKEWVTKVCEVIGGKGGGKDTNAQATGDKIENISQAMELATSFAQMKIGH